MLCELAVTEGVIPAAKDRDGQAFYVRSNHFLPEKVQKWAGLNYKDPIVPKKIGEYGQLSRLNDAGESFFKIADAIEEFL